MIEQGTGGAIVALASADGINAAAMHAPYGAAKAGVISIGQDLRPGVGPPWHSGQRGRAGQRRARQRGLARGPVGGQCGEPVGPAADTGHCQCRPVSRLLARRTDHGRDSTTHLVDGGAVIPEPGVGAKRRCSSASPPETMTDVGPFLRGCVWPAAADVPSAEAVPRTPGGCRWTRGTPLKSRRVCAWN